MSKSWNAFAGARLCTTHHEACDCRELAHYEEVERLRAENAEMGEVMQQVSKELLEVQGPRVARLEAENTELRKIAQAVASGEAMYGELAFALREEARALLGKDSNDARRRPG